MFTFYIIGVAVALLLLLIGFAYGIVYDDVDGSSLIIGLAIVSIISLASWAIVVIIGAMVVFKLAKKRIKDKKCIKNI